MVFSKAFRISEVFLVHQEWAQAQGPMAESAAHTNVRFGGATTWVIPEYVHNKTLLTER